MTERSASKKFLDKNTTLPLTRNSNLEKPDANVAPMHEKFLNKYDKLRRVDSQTSMTGLSNLQRKGIKNSFDRVKK